MYTVADFHLHPIAGRSNFSHNLRFAKLKPPLRASICFTYTEIRRQRFSAGLSPLTTTPNRQWALRNQSTTTVKKMLLVHSQFEYLVIQSSNTR